MANRANIVDGPGYYDFVFLLPLYRGKQDPQKKVLFFLEKPGEKSGDQGVLLLTISKVDGSSRTGNWFFEGQAGGQSFIGCFSTSTGSGWVEPVELTVGENAAKATEISKGER